MTAEQHHEQHENLSTADVASAANRSNATPDSERMTRESGAEMRGTNRASNAPAGADHAAPLFSDSESQDLRSRWSDIQASFVDQPRQAVEQADSLVAETIKHLAEMFANERQQLEGQWDRGDDVSTEDLRVALQRYRSFFDRLLSL